VREICTLRSTWRGNGNQLRFWEQRIDRTYEYGAIPRPYQAEKAREKYPERLRNGIGVGVIRIKKSRGVSEGNQRRFAQTVGSRNQHLTLCR
jgi:hypothetical protein